MTAFALARQKQAGKWQRILAAPLVIGLLIAPHVLPGAEIRPLDALAEQSRAEGPADRDNAADNFPGSAYFFAEGALTPDASVIEPANPHIFALTTGPAAPSVHFQAATALDGLSAETCLTQAIYYEAASEPDEGQRAVAQVVLNRVRSPAYPHSVCGVVFQDSARTDHKCQFTFACDGALARRPSVAGWARAGKVAREALAGMSFAPVGMATHYHTLAVSPFWSSSLQPVAVVGAHIFYRSPGAAGTPSAFTIAYSGHEPQPGRQGPLIPPAPVMAAGGPLMPWTPQLLPPSQPQARDAATSRLPQSTIKPEYQNSGRPLI